MLLIYKKLTRRIRRHSLFHSLPYRIGALAFAAPVAGFSAGAPYRLTAFGVKHVHLHDHDLFLIGTDDWHGGVSAISRAVAVVATITAAVIVVPNLTRAGFQAQVGADKQVGRAIVVQRAQATLIQCIADRFGNLRRVGPRSARWQMAVEPGPTAVLAVVTGRRRVGAAIERIGSLGRRRWQRV